MLPEEAAAPRLVERYARLLSEEEHRFLERRRTAKLRHDYLVARALLRTTLSRYAAVDHRDWVFRRTEHGRPEIDHPPSAEHLRFNLSDTDGLIACAVATEVAIGVDAEKIERRVRPLAVAKRFFAAPEIDALRDLPTGEQATRFLEYWTLKESYIKAVGLGFSLPLRRFAFDIGSPISISFDAPLDDDPQRWQFALFRPTPRHILAVSVAQPCSSIRLFRNVPLVSEQEVQS